MASTPPVVSLVVPQPSSSTHPEIRRPSISRSWNYHEVRTAHEQPWQRAPHRNMQRKREKLKTLMIRHELIPLMDLEGLRIVGNELNIDTLPAWLDYIDIVLDFYGLDEDSHLSTRMLETLSTNVNQLVDHLDKEQLVRMRFFFTFLSQEFQKQTSSSSSMDEIDDLERIYLRGISRTKTRNYCSSTTLRFGQETAVYMADSPQAPDYFIDLKVFDLHRIPSHTNTMDGRDAVVNCKFYGNQLQEYHLYRNVRMLASQCIGVIERRNIDGEERTLLN